MLDRREIDIEIARLEYVESNYPDYAKLADLYVIRDQMDRQKTEQKEIPAQYSSAPDPLPPTVTGGSDFLRAVSGRDPERVWAIMDDLMETLNVVNPRVYRSVMEQVKSV